MHESVAALFGSKERHSQQKSLLNIIFHWGRLCLPLSSFFFFLWVNVRCVQPLQLYNRPKVNIGLWKGMEKTCLSSKQWDLIVTKKREERRLKVISLCLNFIFCSRFTQRLLAVIAAFYQKLACLKYILLKANKTGNLACVVSCCRLSPVNIPSPVNVFICASSIIYLYPNVSLKERWSQRVMLACSQSEHQCLWSWALNQRGVHHQEQRARMIPRQETVSNGIEW